MLLAVTLASVVMQAIIYDRIGFTRVLGIGHMLWIPMFAWMATRLESIAMHPDLQNWLIALAITNAVYFVVDSTDVVRFAKGERALHYRWG